MSRGRSKFVWKLPKQMRNDEGLAVLDRQKDDDLLTFSQPERRFNDGAAVDSGTCENAAPIRTSGPAVAARRRLLLFLNVSTIAALALGVFVFLSADGLDIAELAILAGFFLAMPWTVLGFWNAVIGLVLLHGRGDPSHSVHPFYDAGASGRIPTLESRTALVVTLRNEATEPIFSRFSAMRDNLDSSGFAQSFQFVFLSDTDNAGLAAREEAAFAEFQAASLFGRTAVYRRRSDNRGFKAGNIAEFLDERGEAFDFFLPLDSDSLMGAEVVTRMVAAMERHPRLGILQSLVVGMPSKSGFARIFQFGMRHGMRSFTMGAAWWNADCGSYWGHNAVIRVAPFRKHCMLPTLPGKPPLGGSLLSHDQLEAVFMRRAGYEVRVIPIETASFEINPPTLPDFIRRDLRWCLGNMQYLRLLRTPGLLPLGRFQLAQAILMYVAPPAWLIMTLAACARALWGGFSQGYLELGLTLFAVIFFMAVAPKIAGVIDVALTRGGVAAYGGPARFVFGAVAELLFSMLIAPIVAVSVTIFLAGLPFGRTISWSGQNRDRLGLSWNAAARAMAPHTVLGLALAAAMLSSGWGWTAFFWSLPFTAGLIVSTPLTVLTAAPFFGELLDRFGLFAIPEEKARPTVLAGSSTAFGTAGPLGETSA